MPLAHFLTLLSQQRQMLPWIHAPGAPGLPAAVSHLPIGLRALYEAMDGAKLHQLMYRGEIVGAALEILPLSEVVPIEIALYGSGGSEVACLPHGCVAVCRASDSAFLVALNPAKDEYFTVAPIVPDEAELIARSSEEFYSWLTCQLPNQQQLAIEVQRNAA